jgi:hypothetical protein
VTALAIKASLEAEFEERRRHTRVKVCLTGQFMLENRREFPCSTIDISPGGIAFKSDIPVSLGEKIIAYISQIGRVQGVVRRQFDGGFAVAMSLPCIKREKLSDQLTWFANRALGLAEDRRHDRLQPNDPISMQTMTLPNGHATFCKIIDISRSGASISTMATVCKDTLVTIGQTRGQVVREFNGGIAIEFSRIIQEEIFGPDYRL